MTDRTCQRWFAQFRAGDFSLDGAPLLGRPAEFDGDQIKTLIENNQSYITRERADIHRISKSIKLLVKMKNLSFILRKEPYTLFGCQRTNCLHPGWKADEENPHWWLTRGSQHPWLARGFPAHVAVFCWVQYHFAVVEVTLLKIIPESATREMCMSRDRLL